MAYPPTHKTFAGFRANPYRDGSGRSRISAVIDGEIVEAVLDEAMWQRCWPGPVVAECIRRALPELARERIEKDLAPAQPLRSLDGGDGDVKQSAGVAENGITTVGDVIPLHSDRPVQLREEVPASIATALWHVARDLGVHAGVVLAEALQRHLCDIESEHVAAIMTGRSLTLVDDDKPAALAREGPMT